MPGSSPMTRMASDGRLEQKRLEVRGKNLDGLFLGCSGQGAAHVALDDGGREQALPTSAARLTARPAASAGWAGLGRDAIQAHVRGRVELKPERAFAFAAIERQDLMVLTRGIGFDELVIQLFRRDVGLAPHGSARRPGSRAPSPIGAPPDAPRRRPKSSRPRCRRAPAQASSEAIRNLKC